MASFYTSTRAPGTAASSALGSPPVGSYGSDLDIDIDMDGGDDNAGSATYYDVLKCEGQFALPSAFFAQPLKPAHFASQSYPWASHPQSTAAGGQSDSKHKLRRAGASSALDRGSEYADSAASSSVFRAEHLDNSLPPSVFRLPGGQKGEPGRAALGSMTVGGRSLRRANQVQMSVFDRKVNLV